MWEPTRVARRATRSIVRVVVVGALVVAGVVAIESSRGVTGAADMSWSQTSGFVPIRPVRILDTRSALGLTGSFRSTEPRTLKVTGSVPTSGGPRVVVPAGAAAVVLNVTAVLPTHQGFLTVRPGDDRTTVSTSSLNFWRGAVIPNSVLVALAADGTLQITYDAYGVRNHQTDVLVDVMGYFIGGSGLPGGGTTTTTPGTSVPSTSTTSTSTTDTSTTDTSTTTTTEVPHELGELVTVTIRTDSDATLISAPAGIGALMHSVGVFHVIYPEEMDRCHFSATHRMFSAGSVQSVVMSVHVSEPKSKVVVRIFSPSGLVTNGTDADGFDLIAFCPQ